ncbi:MAG: diacylglycerol kinase family protein [Thermoflexibacteraceae bacterium]|jgi:diacylglycerol kinase
MQINISRFLAQRFKGFGYALQGLRVLLQTQIHAQIHFVASLVVVFLGFLFQLAWYEWCFLVVAMALVWIAEALNTALEVLTDLVSPEFNEKAGKTKDLAAGAVLLAVIAAVVIGGIVFIPKIQKIL